jgi:uncharacterized protein
VTHAALFGSRARGDARADSDTDIMIEIDPEARIGVWDYVGIKDYIAGLFDGPVDVVKRKTLRPYVRSALFPVSIFLSTGRSRMDNRDRCTKFVRNSVRHSSVSRRTISLI